MTEREKRLQEIRERAKNASHGPWELDLTLWPLNELGNQQRKGREEQWTYVEQPEYVVRTSWVHGQAQAKMPIAMISVGPYFEGRNEKLHWLNEPHDPEFIANSREDVPFLLNLIEELGPLAEIGRQHIARSIVAAEKAAGNEVTFEEAYEGATLLSAKDIAEL